LTCGYPIWYIPDIPIATEKILLKLSPDELAAIDRVRGLTARTVWIKQLCADAVLAHDGLSAEAVPVATLPSRVPLARQAPGHFAGCKCLNCERARGNVRD
jgi:hypothetical protein